MTKEEKQKRLDSIVERIAFSHEDFVGVVQDLDEIGRTISAEHLRDIICDLENLLYDLRNSRK